MTELLRQNMGKFILPVVASVLASVLVGFGSTVLTGKIMTEKLASRVDTLEEHVIAKRLVERASNLENQIERHEKALDRDFARHEQSVLALGVKTDDQEKRLTRLETLVGETQALLTEIRTDVKILLRGGQQ